ncbi:MAG: rRNA maturation RNase YbeY [bacterium]|nr:rRNA maturation RNase YbeY [bacterium]
MFSISNRTKGKLLTSRTQLERIKKSIVGRSYELSVAFVGPAEIKRLNRIYRGQNEVTDILSFPLHGKSGEIIFCASEAKRQAGSFSRTPRNFMLFLLIHGLLHLKGYRHGGTMERQEIKFRKQFGI